MARHTFAFLMLFLVLAAGIAVALSPFRAPRVAVRNFEECVRAGHPVLESFPARCRVPGEETFTEEVGNAIQKADIIRVSTPRPNAEIQSPLVVEGEARGNWFFEAEFLIKLVDGEGRELATANAETQDEWMTEAFVPFQARILFPASMTTHGTLVLAKNNPSGLSEHDDALRIPVRFRAVEGETMEVKAFFLANNTPADEECTAVIPVTRRIEKTPAVGRATIEALIAGPTAAERAAGFLSRIRQNTRLLDLSIENGIARVNFDRWLVSGAGDFCWTEGVRAQIEETLKQFPTVHAVEISVEGRFENVFQR